MIKCCLPEWQTVRTSTGNDPRRLDSNRSRSERFFVASLLRLKRYQAVLLVAEVAALAPASGSPDIGLKISAPPEDRRLNIFLRFFVLLL